MPTNYNNDYYNLKRYNWNDINKDVKSIVKFSGVFDSYEEMNMKLYLPNGWYLLVKKGSRKGFYCKIDGIWTLINSDSQLGALVLFGEYSLLMDILTNEYYKYETDTWNKYLEDGLIHILGLEQNLELTLNPNVQPIIYSSVSEILIPLGTDIHLSGENKEGILLTYVADNNPELKLLLNQETDIDGNIYRLHENNILIIHPNTNDNKFYIWLFDKKDSAGNIIPVNDWILLPEYGSFSNGWDINLTYSTFVLNFIRILSFDLISGLIDNLLYLETNLKYSSSKLYQSYNQLKNEISITEDRVKIQLEKYSHQVFENEVLLVGQVYYENGWIRIGGKNSPTGDPLTDEKLILIIENSTPLDIYNLGYKIDNSEFIILISKLPIIDYVINNTSNYDIGLNKNTLQGLIDVSSELSIYLLKQIDGKYYYFDGNEFVITPLNLAFSLQEGDKDPNLFDVLKIELKDLSILNIYNYLTFYREEPYSNTLTIDVNVDGIITMQTLYIPPDKPYKLVTTLIKIDSTQQDANGNGKIILDGNVEIDGNTIMLGSLNFDKLTNDIKQGLYEVIVSSNNGMITEKLDETILNPIKTLQINILKKTDNSKILPLNINNIEIFKDGTKITPGNLIYQGVSLISIDTVANEIVLDCTNQNLLMDFDIKVYFSDGINLELNKQIDIQYTENVSGPVGPIGPSGNYIDYIFKNSETMPLTPELIPNPVDWYNEPQLKNVGEYTWMSKLEKNYNDQLIGSWSTPIRITGDKGDVGPKGDNAPEVLVEYSVDGSTSWHSIFNSTNDIYMRTSTDGGLTWSSLARIVGEKGDIGLTGPQGPQGEHLRVKYITLDQNIFIFDPNTNKFKNGDTSKTIILQLFQKIGDSLLLSYNVYWQINNGLIETTLLSTKTITISSVGETTITLHEDTSGNRIIDSQTVSVLNSLDDSYNLILDNEIISVLADENGSLLSTTDVSTNITLYKGTQEQGTVVKGTSTGGTFTLNSGILTFDVSTMSLDELTCEVYISELPLVKKTFKVVKNKQGLHGDNFYIVYHNNDYFQKPLTPINDGTSDGWTTDPSNLIWMSTKTLYSITEGSWSEPIRIVEPPIEDYVVQELTPYVKIKLLNGNMFNLGTDNITLRLEYYKGDELFNQNDINNNLADNVCNYYWYDLNDNQIILSDNNPEITINKLDINEKGTISCILKEKTKIYYTKDEFIYLEKTEDYGLIYNDDGSLCVTVRDDDVPFDGVKSFAVEESTENLITNPLFNDGISSFSFYNGSYEILNSDLFNNSNMAKIIKVDISNSNSGIWQRIYNLKGETSYSVSAYLKSDNPTDLKITGEVRDINSNLLTSPSKTVTLTNNFKKYEFTFNTPIDTDSITFTFYKKNYIVEEDSFYITAVQVEEKSYQTSFVDGSRIEGDMKFPVDLASKNNFVLSFWIKMNPYYLENDNKYFSIGDYKNSINWNFALGIRCFSPNLPYIVISKRENSTLTYSDKYEDANLALEWSMVTMVYDNGTIKVFYNGNKVIENIFSIPSIYGTNKLWVGHPCGELWTDQTGGLGLVSNLFTGKYKDDAGNVIWTDEYIKYVYKNKIRFNIGSNF